MPKSYSLPCVHESEHSIVQEFEHSIVPESEHSIVLRAQPGRPGNQVMRALARSHLLLQ